MYKEIEKEINKDSFKTIFEKEINIAIEETRQQLEEGMKEILKEFEEAIKEIVSKDEEIYCWSCCNLLMSSATV